MLFLVKSMIWPVSLLCLMCTGITAEWMATGRGGGGGGGLNKSFYHTGIMLFQVLHHFTYYDICVLPVSNNYYKWL